MFKVRNLFLYIFLSLFCINHSNACELMMNDFINEIKACEDESKIKELKGGYYIDSSLLSLQKDGIHLIYGDKDVLIPFLYHDTQGYFLSPQACRNLGDKWMCCRCLARNDMFDSTCGVCYQRRCKNLQ